MRILWCGGGKKGFESLQSTKKQGGSGGKGKEEKNI